MSEQAELNDAERTIMLALCECGHGLDNHGTFAGCWSCLDDGTECARTFESLLLERVAAVVATRVAEAARDAWNECATEANALGWTHDYGSGDMVARNPYRTEASL